MSSASKITPMPQQYSAAATVPLIKSPSLWLPPPVTMPPDIHPLPEDITAYFVYPFTLEEHILASHPHHNSITERRARLAAILHAREVEEEQKEKAALHRMAPGYNPDSVLMPTHRPSASQGEEGIWSLMAAGGKKEEVKTEVKMEEAKEVDPMDALVAQLEEMESHK